MRSVHTVSQVTVYVMIDAQSLRGVSADHYSEWLTATFANLLMYVSRKFSDARAISEFPRTTTRK